MIFILLKNTNSKMLNKIISLYLKKKKLSKKMIIKDNFLRIFFIHK